MAKERVIVDGDWGVDEIELMAVLLAHKEKVEVLGATCVFGNTTHDQVFKNARDAMLFLKHQFEVHVYPGSKEPYNSNQKEGDNAHSENGLGGVKLDESLVPPQKQHSVDFILEQLKNAVSGTITITASGPLTNIAECIRRDPDTMKKVKQIIVMGGCTHDMNAHDMEIRRGNITPHAEFNFQQAPDDAKLVMESGLPITLLPMNCTHQLTFTPERQALIERAYVGQKYFKESIVDMMNGPKALDRMKFNSYPVMHDVHCALLLLYPDLYKVKKGEVSVDVTSGEKSGHTKFSERDESNITVATELVSPDALFSLFLDSLKILIKPTIDRAPSSIVLEQKAGMGYVW